MEPKDDLCDVIRNESATVLASYGDDYYKGSPAVTVSKFGKGDAFYIGTDVNPRFLEQFLDNQLH